MKIQHGTNETLSKYTRVDQAETMTKEQREAVTGKGGKKKREQRCRGAVKMTVKLFLSEFQVLACKKNVVRLVWPGLLAATVVRNFRDIVDD